MRSLYTGVVIALFILPSCSQKHEEHQIGPEAVKVRQEVQKDLVIAHRGSLYWAPEETEAAYRCARNMGADYLELDVQISSDSLLVAFHDKTLQRTSNVTELFPERAEAGIGKFSLIELRSLDAGAWYNTSYPERARSSYEGLKVLTLEDVIMIAEGKRIKFEDGRPVKRMVEGQWGGHYCYENDPVDKGNRPGIYLETKSPKPGVEKLLRKELTRLGWNINEAPREIPTTEGKVAIANTPARLILQSFSRKSLIKLEQELPNIPKCLLLWHPKLEEDLEENLRQAVAFCVENNVHIMGPSLAGGPNNYGELSADWMCERYHRAGLLVHPYTIDTREQQQVYLKQADGFFTNRSDLSLDIYERKSAITTPACLEELGYN